MLVSSDNPILIMFLIDRSGSMRDRDPETGVSLAESTARAINSTIYDIALNTCMSNDGGVKDRVHLSVYGYGDRRSPDLVHWGLEGLPDSRGWVPAEEWMKAFTRIEEEIVTTDGERNITRQIPVWVEPLAEGRTAMATAFRRAGKLIEAHMRQYPDSHVPIVINITDGHPGDVRTNKENWSKLQEAAAMITGHDGTNGNPLLLNVHLDVNVKDTHFFPQTEPENTDRFARNMFRISSPMPDWMVVNAKNHGFKLEFDSRALIMNAWPGLLSSFLSIGTTLRQNPNAVVSG